VAAAVVRPAQARRHLIELAVAGQAESRGTTLNRLIDDMATVMLAEFDAETRFKLRAARGQGQEARGLELLAKAAGTEPPR